MREYPIRPVPFTRVGFDDEFWSPRLQTNRNVTLPYVFQKCRETGRIDNFLKAAGRLPGKHEGLRFNDSDVFKALEGAAYTLALRYDPELDRLTDEVIEVVAAAQEPDGYLYTPRTIDPEGVDPQLVGRGRWSNLRVNHELYNLGHLYEAAVAHFQATGKRSLLDVAIRSADLVDSVFGPNGRRDVPGHQEIELGLAKLHRVTGEERYLHLAEFFLDERGRPHGRELYQDFGLAEYMQDHLPVTEQSEAAGHAVRATYMYSAMADVAALAGKDSYLPALDAIWRNVVGKKMYLTGGIGSRHHGEAFGDNYELPNATAYNETCAAIGNVMWNHRMFLLHGDGRYLDVLERSLYNGLLAGVAMDGTEFFYPNPLESDGKYAFNIEGVATRSPWFTCSCCPTNAVRFFPSLPGYAYANTEDSVYVNLFVQGSAQVELPDGCVRLRQRTAYPWSGQVAIEVECESPLEFTLAVRLPGWARDRPVASDLYHYVNPPPGEIELRVNGRRVDIDESAGFARLPRRWASGDTVELTLPLAPRTVATKGDVVENRGRLAVECGPLVYCAEAADNRGRALGLQPGELAGRTVERRPDLLGGVNVVRAGTLTLIPYYAWSHRGTGEMQVWCPAPKSRSSREPGR
jgi:DUF1680 family protein